MSRKTKKRAGLPRPPRVVWVQWDPIYGIQLVWETKQDALDDDPEFREAHGGRVLRYLLAPRKRTEK